MVFPHIHNIHAHHVWSASMRPVSIIDSGQEVSFELLDGSHNQLSDKSTKEDVVRLDFSILDPAVGPVYVNGAEPGNCLQIEVLDLQCAAYGWTAICPGFGLLADEFPEAGFRLWDLRSHDGFTVFQEGIHIPLRPFLGIMGVAPAGKDVSTIPPWNTGGNLDCRQLGIGAKLWLPVQVRGALFSCGDGHAAQGDGEVCGTAIETPMYARLRLTVIKGGPPMEQPHYLTSLRQTASVNHGSVEFAAIGVDADLREAARQAVRGVIRWLGSEKSLSRESAYMLISVSGNLSIVEAVNMPNFAVSCRIPLSIFV